MVGIICENLLFRNDVRDFNSEPLPGSKGSVQIKTTNAVELVNIYQILLNFILVPKNGLFKENWEKHDTRMEESTPNLI